MDIQIQIAVR